MWWVTLTFLLWAVVAKRQCTASSDAPCPHIAMRAVIAREPGEPSVLTVVDRPVPTCGEKEVVLTVGATAINRADTLQRKGKYNPPPGATDILGLEAAGVVKAVGAGCTKGFKVGDRVMALLAGGGYAEVVAVDEGQVMPAPDGFTHEQAAAIPETWLTAYQLLYFVAKVKAGDYVLIHAGGSGVGQAAVQLVKAAGGHPVVTAGTPEKLEACKALGAEAAVNYKEEGWPAAIKAATPEGKGVNIVLDPVGAGHYNGNIQVLTLDSTWVLYGLMGGKDIPQWDMGPILAKRITLAGTTLRTRSIPYKTELVDSFAAHALPRFQSGAFIPNIDTVLPSLEEAGRAHATMEANTNAGKIVLKVANL